jgi:dTDP-4-dehydrorhamnose reductase
MEHSSATPKRSLIPPKDRSRNLLITGASGFIGGNLAVRGSSLWNVCGTFLNNEIKLKNVRTIRELDVTDIEAVRSIFYEFLPSVVVHCAAISSMEYCANHPELATEVNVVGSRNISLVCKEIDARVIYLSTDLVFDGFRGNYEEEDTPNPICVYGRTKLAGEKAILSFGTGQCIVRIALTFGFSSNLSRCFTESLIDKLQAGMQVSLFTDEYRSPIYVDSLCNAILDIADRRETGTFHLGGPDRINRHEFGLLAADVFGFDRDLIVGTSVGAFGFRDRRPKDCSLNSHRAARTFLLQIPLRKSLTDMAALYPRCR